MTGGWHKAANRGYIPGDHDRNCVDCKTQYRGALASIRCLACAEAQIAKASAQIDGKAVQELLTAGCSAPAICKRLGYREPQLRAYMAENGLVTKRMARRA